MREIKFRFWDEGENEFHEGEWTLFDLLQYPSQELGESGGNGFIPTQYIGLKDRNGRDIYEGDILNNDDDQTYIIESEMKWCFGDDPIYGWQVKSYDDAEIIGNIYENPELIPGEDE